MNHKAIEKPKHKPVPKRQYVFLSLKICSIAAVLLLFIWWLFPIVTWRFNYLKWQNADIEDYKLYLYRAELLRDTDYIRPFDFYFQTGNGTMAVQPAHVFKDDYDAVCMLFSIARDKIWNPFARCEVTYDEEYGFPDLINCGQWHQIQTFGFDP